MKNLFKLEIEEGEVKRNGGGGYFFELETGENEKIRKRLRSMLVDLIQRGENTKTGYVYRYLVEII